MSNGDLFPIYFDTMRALAAVGDHSSNQGVVSKAFFGFFAQELVGKIYPIRSHHQPLVGVGSNDGPRQGFGR
jgi:hypothetical protein